LGGEKFLGGNKKFSEKKKGVKRVPNLLKNLLGIKKGFEKSFFLWPKFLRSGKKFNQKKMVKN